MNVMFDDVQENDVQDDLSWVLTNIHALGMKCEESDITPPMLEILHSLMSERKHYQSQTQKLSEYSTEVNAKNTQLEKERDNLRNEAAMLKQDLNVANERVNALKSEHREVKCQWLNEKSELESRHFQTMALNTQIQGTLRKKERDYDKLQNQLSKITTKSSVPRSGVKGKNESTSTTSIVISKPLKRNSTQQGNPNEGTLQMAEIIAAKATIASLESENENLRVAVEDLTQNFEDFQANMANLSLENKHSNLEKNISSPDGNTRNNEAAYELPEDVFKQLSTLEQAKYVERRLDAVNDTLTAVVSNSHATPTKISTPGCGKYGSMPTSARKRLVGNTITGTPNARPFNWIVKQANSEVKVLRERAEKLNWNVRPSPFDDITIGISPSKVIECDIDGKENETPQKVQLKRNEKILKETLMEYRLQLEEACAVICEQDRLIHAALVGSNNFPQVRYVEEDEESGDNDFEDSSNGTVTPSSKLALGSCYDASDWSVENFLPSVSPDTMTVLQESEFATLPPPVTLPMSEE